MFRRLIQKLVCHGKPPTQEGGSAADMEQLPAAAEGDVPHYREFDIRNHYNLKGIIGVPGSFGEVRVGVHIETGKAYAIKMMKLDKCSSSAINSEVAIMEKLQHCNMASIVAVYQYRKKFFIVMEKYDGGDLFDVILAKGGRFNKEQEAKVLIRQMLEGLQYLHSNHIAHCDIKLCNILISEADQTVKIIDFGFSQILDKPEEMLTAEVGSPSFVAPEVLMGSYNEQCDMWAIGVVVFIMLFGFNPFNPKAVPALECRNRISKCIMQGFSPEVRSGYGAFFPKAIPVSEAARDFISGLLTSDWRHRLTSSEALAHPWMCS